MPFPYTITKKTVHQAKNFIQRRSIRTSFYFKLKHRLLCLVLCVTAVFILAHGHIFLIIFFIVDYLLYRAHRNFICAEQINYLEHFLETQSLEHCYLEGINHTLCLQNLSGSRLTYNLPRKEILDRFIQKYNFKEAKLLDVGCSGGWLTESYKSLPNYSLLFGVDLNLPGLRVYKNIHPDISPPVLGNVEVLPFKDTTLDIIFATDIIEHLFRPDLFLQEVRRVLRPAGIFYLSTNNAHYISFSHLINPLMALEKIAGLYMPFVLPVRNFVYGEGEPSERYYHTDFERKDFFAMLFDAGFQIHRVKSFNFFWDVFAPLGEKVENKLPIALYFILQASLDKLPFLKYTGEHWYVELTAANIEGLK